MILLAKMPEADDGGEEANPDEEPDVVDDPDALSPFRSVKLINEF